MTLTLAHPPRVPDIAAGPSGRYPKWVFVSLAAHALILFALSRDILVRQPAETQPVRVTIFEPAPPPPSLGGNPNPVAPVVIEPPPQPVPKVEPPAHPLKVAKKPVHKPVEPTEVRQPPPVAAPPAPSMLAEDTVGSPEGSAGGVPGGVVGGQLSGTVGGHGDRVLRADEVATPPVAISRTMPQYPPAARARGIEGLVVLEGVVDLKGRVEDDSVAVVQSIDMLNDAAIKALRQWRFRAGRDDHGDAVRVIVQAPIRFRLR